MSKILPSQLSDVPYGSTISFRSKNPNDAVLYTGVLQATGSYRSVRHLAPQQSYNEAVRQVDPTVSSDMTTLEYLWITINNNSQLPTDEAFALDWIAAGSLESLANVTEVTLVVEDPNADPNRIVDILTQSGYTARITNTVLTGVGS